MVVTVLMLSACSVGHVTPVPTQTAAPPTPMSPSPAPEPSPIPTLTPSVTPFVPNYAPLQHKLTAFAEAQLTNADIDLGVAFVDLTSGDRVSIRGEERFYSLSTFKAPLAVYYLWLVEQGSITEQNADVEHIAPMLSRSSNTDTTCIIERVGGLAGFNDWLAEQGLPRVENFIIAWDSWPCQTTGFIPEPDMRYIHGDVMLGIPGDNAIRQCPGPNVRCDKAFSPDDLATFYTRLNAGQIVSLENVERWLGWMKKPAEDTYFDDQLMEGALPMTAYTKEGFRPVDSFFGQNFYHETGIVGTPQGDYVLLIFMQNNPEWPGGELISSIAAMVHAAFEANHPVP